MAITKTGTEKMALVVPSLRALNLARGAARAFNKRPVNNSTGKEILQYGLTGAIPAAFGGLSVASGDMSVGEAAGTGLGGSAGWVLAGNAINRIVPKGKMGTALKFLGSLAGSYAGAEAGSSLGKQLPIWKRRTKT